jgi:hypothetical protein
MTAPCQAGTPCDSVLTISQHLLAQSDKAVACTYRMLQIIFHCVHVVHGVSAYTCLQSRFAMAMVRQTMTCVQQSKPDSG